MKTQVNNYSISSFIPYKKVLPTQNTASIFLLGRVTLLSVNFCLIKIRELSLLLVILLFPLLTLPIFGNPNDCCWNLQNPTQITNVVTLTAGMQLKREIEPKEIHSYRIDLVAGQYLRTIVDKLGADVTAKLIAPNHQPIIIANTNTEKIGPVPVTFISELDGAYTLEVLLNPNAKSGTYAIKIEALRQPTQVDQDQANAEKLYWEADQLFAQPTLASRLKALEKYEQSLPKFQALGDQNFARSCFHMAGFIYQISSQLQKALENYEKSLALATQLGYKANVAVLLNNIGGVYDIQGDPQKALNYYDQSLTLSVELNDLGQQGDTLNNIGVIYYSLSDTQKALRYFNRALAIKKNNGGNIANTLNNIASVYTIMGEQQRAQEYLKESLELRRKAKDIRGEGMSLFSLGYTYFTAGEVATALEYYNQALPLRRSAGDRRGEALTLDSIGVAQNALGNYQSAINYIQQALELQRAIKDRRSESLTLEHLGTVYTSAKNYEYAFTAYQEALNVSQSIGDKRIEAAVLKGMSRVARERGDYVSARKYIEDSIAKIETVRGLVDVQLRASFLGVQHSAYEYFIDLLMQLHRLDPAKKFDQEALQVSEKARARSLLETISESGADIRKGVTPELLNREHLLSQQINAKAERLMQARNQQNSKDRVTQLNKELMGLEDEYQQTQAAIRQNNPEYAAITQPHSLSASAIQKELDANTILLEYALGDARSFVWAVTNNTVTSYELPPQAEIKAVAKQVYDALIARTQFVKLETLQNKRERIMQADAQFAKVSDKLSEMLLAPLASQLGNKRLVIVADSTLQYVPFAALPAPEFRVSSAKLRGQAAKPETRNSQPLIVEHEIVTLPSASTIAVLRQQLAGRPVAPKMLAVIADPVFTKEDARSKIRKVKLSTSSTANETAARNIVHTEENSVGEQNLVGGYNIPRLPFTRQEADRIFAVAPQATSFRATDFKANRATVTDPELGKYRYLHFATHGLVDSERPGLSSLVLSLVNEQGKPEDGFFRAHELYNLKLPAELVVLSACQTGLGKEIKGEGLIGLSRGFMYAGAARVIMSLWSVNDQATAELMTKLYQKMLKEGESPAAALRSSQIQMWKQKEWQSPYYWAAFTLQGEWK